MAQWQRARCANAPGDASDASTLRTKSQACLEKPISADVGDGALSGGEGGDLRRSSLVLLLHMAPCTNDRGNVGPEFKAGVAIGIR